MSGIVGHRGLLLRSGAGGGWTPAELFVGGHVGAYWDFTDPGSLWSNAGRTIPASINGQVQGVTDLSGNGNHLSTTTTTILRQTGYTYFPGGVDGFNTGALAGPPSEGWTGAFAVRSESTADHQAWLDADLASNRLAQALHLTLPGPSPFCLYFHSAGNTSFDGAGIAFDSDAAYVVSVSPTAQMLRANKSTVNSLTAAPTLNTPSSFYLGVGSSWLGTSDKIFRRAKGRAYAVFFIRRILSESERDALENWLYSKAGL